MKEQKPQMGPAGYQGEAQAGGGSAPSAAPPAAASAKGDCGCHGNEAAASTPPASTGTSGNESAPMVMPASAGGAVALWQNNKRITALWSIDQNRNSWVHVEGIGWRRLANNSDSAVVALGMLAAHARDKSAVVNYREESDGMIREIYVW